MTEEGQPGPSRTQEASGQDLLDRRLGELRYCIDFLDRFEKVKRNLIQQFSGGKTPLPEAEFKRYAHQAEEVDAIYERCRTLDEDLSMLDREEARLRDLLTRLEPWEWLDVPLSKASEEGRFALVLCEVPCRGLEALRADLEKTSDAVHVQGGPGTKRAVPVAILCLARDKGAVLSTLAQRGAVLSQLSSFSGSAHEEADAAREALSGVTRRRQEAMARAKVLLADRVKVLSLCDSLSLERDREVVAGSFPATRGAFAVEGWVREVDLQALRTAVTSRFDLVHIESRDPVDGEIPPVALDNPGIVAPFEAVTEIYSMPRVGSVDPTLALAPFFFVFFGLALGDVAYGAGLTALSLLLLKKIKMAGLAKKLFTLLAVCGLSSAIVGVVTGSWLGNLFRIPPLWFDPMENPIIMLGISFALGVIHIYVGLGIKFYSNVKQGKVIDAVYDQGFWYAFLTGLLLALGGSALRNAGLSSAGRWLAIAGAGGLVLTQGRAHTNPIRRLGSGLISLYGVTGYLADVLSYSRLLALGLASSVIAVVIDDMAVRMLGVPFIGWIPMILLLAVGHSFNLGINVVGSYVHSSRLQYVEFFSKFFEGGGRRFVPFRKRTRYIEVIQKGEA